MGRRFWTRLFEAGWTKCFISDSFTMSLIFRCTPECIQTRNIAVELNKIYIAAQWHAFQSCLLYDSFRPTSSAKPSFFMADHATHIPSGSLLKLVAPQLRKVPMRGWLAGASCLDAARKLSGLNFMSWPTAIWVW